MTESPEDELLERVRVIYAASYPNVILNMLNHVEELKAKNVELRKKLDVIKQEPFYIEEKKCRGRKR